MTNIEPIQSIQQVIQAIGNPDQIKGDPRAGLSAIWGSREKGAFMVERGSIDSEYQMVLLPGPESKYSLFTGTFTAEQLSQWFTENVSIIQEVLAGK